MNYKVIFNTIGKIALILAVLLVIPTVLSASLLENSWWALLATAGISLVIGLVLTFAIRPRNKAIFSKEGLIIVALSWIYVSAIGALPFVLSRAIPNYIDAFFETCSGFSTTGATILTGTQIESMDRGLLFWRSFTHWIGGMGVIVFLMAFESGSANRGMHILRAEMPGPTVDKIVPRARSTARILYLLYIGFTVVQIIALLIAGMPVFDSFVHAFGTAGTGGFGILHMEILDKMSLPCTDHTTRKEILQFILSAASQIMSNACLNKADVLGLGVGVMPVMIGRMRVYYKDGMLDFKDLTQALSTPQMPQVFCGNAVWLLSLANADLQRSGVPTGNTVYLHLGSRIHISVLRPEKQETDYLTYSYLTERCIIHPGGRQQDGYPAGSVRAQLSTQAMQARIAEIYSRERTPFLYNATEGYIEHVTLEQMYRAISAGDARCEGVVREIMQDWSVLLHNLVCSYQCQRVVLHHFGLSERGFTEFRSYVREFVGDDIAERIVCSTVESRTDFLAGCSLVLMKNFYLNGGLSDMEPQ